MIRNKKDVSPHERLTQALSLSSKSPAYAPEIDDVNYLKENLIEKFDNSEILHPEIEIV